MRLIVITLMSMIALAGCATTPQQDRTISSNYKTLSDCVYRNLASRGEPGLSKADTNGMTRITAQTSSTLLWELTVSASGAKGSSVEFVPHRNMWGSDVGGAKEIWPVVESCSR